MLTACRFIYYSMFSKASIARFDQLETPFYYYDLNLLQKTVTACQNAAAPYGYHVHYALKRPAWVLIA
jgi:diaminopimelate decarboxylase